jgi:endoglucanase
MRKVVFLFLLVLPFAGCRTSPTPGDVVHRQPTPLPTPTATIAPATDTPVPTSTSTPVPTVTPVANSLDPYEQARKLGRGVNLGNALEAPREGAWGVVLKEGYLQLIAEAGFDTVRVPIRWSAHASPKPPYTIDETFFERVDWVIENAFAQGLNVVINMHHYDELFQEPAGHQERFIAMWRQIVLRYREMPASLYFEPLNEPNSMLTPEKWNAVLAETIHAIRELDKFHTIVISGAEWGGIQALAKLKIPEEETNVVCTFHFYDPFPFTHQGADWVGREYSTTGVQWPGPPAVKLTPSPRALEISWLSKWFDDYNNQPAKYNPCGPQEIAKDLDWAVKWGERLGRPLWLGEFGAYSKADMQSRINWTRFVRQEAEARGFSWAYWEFCAGFGVYDPALQKWNEGLLEALVPSE